MRESVTQQNSGADEGYGNCKGPTFLKKVIIN